MNARALIDKRREAWVSNPRTSPTRSVTYTRTSDDVAVVLNSFVGGGVFNDEEKKKLEDHQSFSGLKLDQKPQVNDTVTYDGEVFKVKRYTKLGSLWTVFGKKSRHNGRPGN